MVLRESGTSKELGETGPVAHAPRFLAPSHVQVVISVGWLPMTLSLPGLQAPQSLGLCVKRLCSVGDRLCWLHAPKVIPGTLSQEGPPLPTASLSPQSGPTKWGVTVTETLQRIDQVVRKSD